MRGRRTIAVALAAILLASCSRNDGRTLTPPRPDQTLSIVTTTVATTVAPSVDGGTAIDDSGDGGVSDGGIVADNPTLLAPWVSGEVIPDLYTCKGADQAPSLVWRGMDSGEVEQAIVMTDVDADNFVQWIVVGIPPTLTNLDPSRLPGNALVGMNSAGTTGYRGPCPTSGRHTYYITLYALRSPSGVTASTPAAEAITAINAVQTESVSVSGTATA